MVKIKEVEQMELKTISCAACEKTCLMRVLVEGNKVRKVNGNSCFRGLNTAKNQIQQPEGEGHSGFTGRKKIICTGCRNACHLDVALKEGIVDNVFGEGCRRGIINAKKQLER
ncbi:MAG: hypothetical protein ACI4TF_13560 [Oliverpabstia sp.]